jgi:hypothetical protein
MPEERRHEMGIGDYCLCPKYQSSLIVELPLDKV